MCRCPRPVGLLPFPVWLPTSSRIRFLTGRRVMGGNHQHNTQFSRRDPYLLLDVPPPRPPPLELPPLLRLPPELRLPPLLRLPPELDPELDPLLPTEPELLVSEPLFRLEPERGLTDLPLSLERLLRVLTAPPDRVLFPVVDRPFLLLPGRTWRVLLVRSSD